MPHGGAPAGLSLGPHPGLPGMGAGAAGLLGFGAGLPPGGPPHPAAVASAAHSIAKAADLHSRAGDDIKRPSSRNTSDERLVSKWAL